jgi:hypothetical protein
MRGASLLLLLACLAILGSLTACAVAYENPDPLDPAMTVAPGEGNRCTANRRSALVSIFDVGRDVDPADPPR